MKETVNSNRIKQLKRLAKYLFLYFGVILIGASIYFWIILQPSNNRNWEYGFETLPKISFNQDNITIRDLRDFSFSDNSIKPNYLNKTVSLAKLERAWFVVEPFTIKPFTNFKGIAHTYFVFDFEDQEPIVVSVEARREKNEKYDAWIGLLNQYELIFVWGTERDETIRRVTVEHNPLYMYPLTISRENAQKLFLEIAKTSQDLETKPRFYNSFLSNCTNELAKVANKVQPNSIPLNMALFLPGYSEPELYKLGFIPNNLPLEQIKQKYFVSDFINELHTDPEFSKKLRAKLL